jgi:3',5'-cyclic AMP phosphodiesterase CpdA
MTRDFNTFSFKKLTREQMQDAYLNEILLRFVHISDTHISPDPEYNEYDGPFPARLGAETLVREVNALPFTPDFILHTGDIAYDPEEAAYTAARDILGRLKQPVHYLVGNHDDRAALQRVMTGAEPHAPYDYEFEVNGVQVVCVDTNMVARPNAGGGVTDDQLAWLRARTEKADDRPLIIAAHHNVLPIGSYFWDTFMRLYNGEAFHQAVLPARARLRGVFFGHVHMATETYRDGILYSSVNSSWYQLHCYPGQEEVREDRNALPGFNVVTITRSQTFIRRHYFTVKP